ncbi:hypothetical protein FRC09_017096 [Ceratobasidium sp. 395]|nr:hypothetical protein FRC09_017096 [Ceratobasidium sp. 395]
MKEAIDQIGAELLQPQTITGSEASLIPTTHQHEALASEPAQTSLQEPDQTTAPHNSHHAYASRSHEDNRTISAANTTGNYTSAPDLLPTLSPTPAQEEIEAWLVEYQKQRKSSRSQQGLADIVCPLSGCGRVSRRPRALKVGAIH